MRKKSLCRAAGRSGFNFHVILQVKNEAEGLLCVCVCMRGVAGTSRKAAWVFFLQSKAIVVLYIQHSIACV